MIVIVLALAIRLFYLTGIEAYPKFELIKNRLDDQVVFDAWAKSVVRGEVFDYRTTGHEFAHWVAADPGVYPQAPLYPFLVSVFYAVFGFEYDGWRLAQMTLGALACGLLFWLARRFGPQRLETPEESFRCARRRRQAVAAERHRPCACRYVAQPDLGRRRPGVCGPPA